MNRCSHGSCSDNVYIVSAIEPAEVKEIKGVFKCYVEADNFYRRYKHFCYEKPTKAEIEEWKVE